MGPHCNFHTLSACEAGAARHKPPQATGGEGAAEICWKTEVAPPGPGRHRWLGSHVIYPLAPAPVPQLTPLGDLDGDSEQPEFTNGSSSLVCEGKWTNMKSREDFCWDGGDTHWAQGAVVGAGQH